MLLKQTISPIAATDAALDQAQLYALGLDEVRRSSRRSWTDHNTHDPGITILEMLCYALTDLSYRAQFPLEDLLAKPTDNEQNMASQFFTAGQVLPNEPLTVTDYRRLLIDHPKIRNAWIVPRPLRYFADTVTKKLLLQESQAKGLRRVDIRGLYRVWIECVEEVTTPEERDAVILDARRLLHRHRNLCEDFVEVEPVETQFYSLCAEIELAADGDPTEVAAQIQFQVDQYLAPPIHQYTLAEMLERRHEDGRAYTVEEIFEGPRLTHGFLDEQEVAKAELRTDVRLSDIISVIMDIDGVLAVRDIVVNEAPSKPQGDPAEPKDFAKPANKWRLRVPEGRQPRLSGEHGRLVFYQRNLPLQPHREKVAARVTQIRNEQSARPTDAGQQDLPIPLGRDRSIATYPSFQHHFPTVYGLSETGLPGNATDWRRAQALQLKGYLLFFDQVLANYLAQLSQVNRLFSRDSAGPPQTYFAQLVRSIPNYQKVYSDTVADESSLPPLESAESARQRRNRMCDHLLARIAEDFHHYANIMRTNFDADEQGMIDAKCEFLKSYPKLGAERRLAYNYTLTEGDALWDSQNVSGLERRLARLLGIRDFSRRDLATAPAENPIEGMYLIENILLRPEGEDDPILPICVDPACADCADDDPYSYRVHVVLPAHAGRFRDMDFRYFVEETIRLETPAHILPKICWVDNVQMATFEQAYRDWVSLRAGVDAADRRQKLEAFRDALFGIKSVYPSQKLNDCGGEKPPFILGRTQLGSSD